jgi:hypothetical protein
LHRHQGRQELDLGLRAAIEADLSLTTTERAAFYRRPRHRAH